MTAPDSRDSRQASTVVRSASHTHTLRVARVLADATAISLGFTGAYWLRYWVVAAGIVSPSPAMPVHYGSYTATAVIFSAIALTVFWVRGLYSPRASVLNFWEFATALESIAMAAAYLFALLFAVRLGIAYSRIVIGGAILFSAFLVMVERRIFAAILGRLHLSGRVGRRVLIHGCDATGRLLMKKLIQSPHMNCAVIGFVDDRAALGSRVRCRTAQTGASFEAPVLGRGRNLLDTITQYQIDEVFVVASSVTSEQLRDILQMCTTHGCNVGVVPDLEDVRADQLRADDISAMPVLRLASARARPLYFAMKRAIDFLGASALMVLTSPLWLVSILAIKLDSPGPVFFVQERVGHRGRRFRTIKFRTMRTDANPYAFSPNGDSVDPRITRVGRVLRAAGLDELPQLLNVLRGEMSLVGPRPEMPFIVDRYTDIQRKRLEAVPGITGVWQLSADRHVEIHDNIEYDLYYIHHQSLMLDALLLLETVFFTVGLVLKAFSRSDVRTTTPAPATASVAGVDESYVLVAFDQRQNDVALATWKRFVPASYTLGANWPIRLLVAPNTVEVFDRLLEEPARRLGREAYRVDYVSYRSRAELQRAVRGALLVITDLPHVARWAEDAQVGLLTVTGDRVVGQSRARGEVDQIRLALNKALPERPRPSMELPTISEGSVSVSLS
jgi:exopolysaccharide biosynthesis polyprenyl glycosylphosphotransferase